MPRSSTPVTRPVILMHAGRLLQPHLPATPEGLTRVELAYATWLLDGEQEVIWLRWDAAEGDIVVVSQDEARERISTAAARWEGRRGRATTVSRNTGLRSWLRTQEARLTARSPVAHAAGRLARELRLVARRWQRELPRLRGLPIRSVMLRQRQLDPVMPLADLLGDPPARWQGRELISLDVAYNDPPMRCPGMAALDRFPGTRRVCFVHDLIPLDAPELCEADGEELFRSMLQRILAPRTLTVVTNSQYTADRLEDWAARWDRPRPAITVNPLGTDLIDAPLPMHARPEPGSFITVGTIGPRKNHSLLLHLWRLMLDDGIEPPTLHIVGKRWGTPGVGDVQRVLDHPGRLAPYVIEHTDLPDDRLRELLLASRALLLPSWIEGWGMPLAEALALGVPAICSDIPPFREVGGAVPRYVSPLDGLGWQAAIRAYRDPDDPDRQRQLTMLAGGEHRVHRWSEHFARFEDIVLQTDHG